MQARSWLGGFRPTFAPQQTMAARTTATLLLLTASASGAPAAKRVMLWTTDDSANTKCARMLAIVSQLPP